MRWFMAFVLLLCCAVHADETVLIKEYTFEYDDDDTQSPFMFCFNQKCTIDNEQKNVSAHPVVEIQPKSAHELTPSTGPVASLFSIKDLLSPLHIGIAGCLLGALYYLKTKLSLYSLSKACVQQAFWSLWERKKSSGLMHNQDQENTLLYDILQTYQTDHCARAMAQFLQDVDTETELLYRYLEQAQDTQSGIMQFILPDMSNDITEAQVRLAKLASLKQTVLAWLAHGATSYGTTSSWE